VVLIEEPELFLRPQAQRYFYRLLRAFAERGNQVLYSTHEPAFLNELDAEPQRAVPRKRRVAGRRTDGEADLPVRVPRARPRCRPRGRDDHRLRGQAEHAAVHPHLPGRGPGRTVELAPDFEAIAGLRGHRHKPARAFERFARIEREHVPAALGAAVERIVALARGRP